MIFKITIKLFALEVLEAGLILCIFFIIIPTESIGQQITKTKIACVGDSITYGAGMVNRENNAYPKQLQALLGDRYIVRNFGVNGRTILKNGNLPYWNTDEYKKALEYIPDIVYIKFGSNDSKKVNRPYFGEFITDYQEMIKSFKKINRKVRVVLLLPIPSYMKDTTQIWNPIITDKIIPMTQQVAYNNNLEVIDLYQLFVNHPSLLPDTIHPSSIGANIIARRIYENIVVENGNKINLKNNSAITIISNESFFGYNLLNFKFKNWNCKIVKPKFIAKGKPWVLRARFWGHEPQVDISLLERGFHIAYCDVANLFGSEKAIIRWNSFYELMKKEGFSKKVVLEGMSRGGLIVYNWTTKNPEKVACIYADAPVLDGKSWPGGLGKGKGSISDWKIFRRLYKLNNKKKIENFADSPIDRIEIIAKSNIPLLHVCGLDDKVVPVDENTLLFEKKLLKAGGNITTVYKKNVGHHPHSLKNPTQIVKFILRATGNSMNFATLMAPGFEYRLGAGWKKGSDWWKQMNDINDICKNTKNVDLLLIGNSITQGYGGKRPNVTYKPGDNATKMYFNNIKFINGGISGDRTENVAWRIKNGVYDKCNPKFVVLTIGVNNFPYQTADEISQGIKVVLKTAIQKFPNSKIILIGPLPSGMKKNSKRRVKYNRIHDLISKIETKKNTYYFNLIDEFKDKNGDLDSNYYEGDGIHLKPMGYNIWSKKIKNIIETN